MEVGQETAKELVTEEECDNQPGHFLVQDAR